MHQYWSNQRSVFQPAFWSKLARLYINSTLIQLFYLCIINTHSRNICKHQWTSDSMTVDYTTLNHSLQDSWLLFLHRRPILYCDWMQDKFILYAQPIRTLVSYYYQFIPLNYCYEPKWQSGSKIRHGWLMKRNVRNQLVVSRNDFQNNNRKAYFLKCHSATPKTVT